MNIAIAYPPNIDQINEVFPVKGKRGVIFTFGDTIYNPSGITITPALKSHEGVHFNRQTRDIVKITAWWDRYLIDAEFRFAEELPAHRAEFKTFCNLHRDRSQRSRFLHDIASRLSGPLYGDMVNAIEARKRIAA